MTKGILTNKAAQNCILKEKPLAPVSTVEQFSTTMYNNVQNVTALPSINEPRSKSKNIVER